MALLEKPQRPGLGNQGAASRLPATTSTIPRSDAAEERHGRRRRLTVTLGSPGCWAEVRGHGSRELLNACGLENPVWVSRIRCWSTSVRRARDVIALAELRGYDVTVTESGERR